MITERQLAEDVLLRLRLAGFDYPPLLDSIDGLEQYDTGDQIEVSLGGTTIRSLGTKHRYWVTDYTGDDGQTRQLHWLRHYGEAMNFFIKNVCAEFGHART